MSRRQEAEVDHQRLGRIDQLASWARLPIFQSAEAGEEMIFNLSNLDDTSRVDVGADGTISSVAEAEATADKLAHGSAQSRA